jgi:hypothetical protein
MENTNKFKNTTNVGNEVLADVSVSKIESFVKWLEEQKHEIRGGKKMYDVRYYKWLTEAEMYEYWLQRVYSR